MCPGEWRVRRTFWRFFESVRREKDRELCTGHGCGGGTRDCGQKDLVRNHFLNYVLSSNASSSCILYPVIPVPEADLHVQSPSIGSHLPAIPALPIIPSLNPPARWKPAKKKYANLTPIYTPNIQSQKGSASWGKKYMS